jgi:hypothetical protein
MCCMPPPCFFPYRRKTPAETRLLEKQIMADQIMSALKQFQPKRKRKQK